MAHWRCLPIVVLYCQTLRASANLELTLFSPRHNNKNPHQNLPEGSKLQVWNFAQGLYLMEENLKWKTTVDGRQPFMEGDLLLADDL